MKTILFALLIVLCLALAEEAQALKRATFVGTSASTTSGDAGGVMGMHLLCRATYGKQARMCTTQDVVDGLNFKTSLNAIAWIQVVPVLAFANDDVVDVTGFTLSSDPPNCNGWRSNTAAGVFVAGVTFSMQQATCNAFRPVTCCQ